jgi:hypothetical protein
MQETDTEARVRELELEIARLNGVIDGMRQAFQSLRPPAPAVCPSVWPSDQPPTWLTITTTWIGGGHYI